MDQLWDPSKKARIMVTPLHILISNTANDKENSKLSNGKNIKLISHNWNLSLLPLPIL
jgi:hypothetical protein